MGYDMKKFLATLFLLATTANFSAPPLNRPSHLFPWKGSLQGLCLASMMKPSIAGIYSAWHENYYQLTSRCIVPFIDEQLQKHGFKPAAVKLFLRQDPCINASATIGGNLVITEGFANQIYQGLKNNPDPATNPSLGEATITLAHECGHLKGHHAAVRTLFSLVSIPTLWFAYNKLVSKGDEYMETKMRSMKEGKLKAALAYIKDAAAFTLPFLATWCTHKILYLGLSRFQEYQADTYAFSHAPSPLALCADAAFFNSQNQEWNYLSLLSHLWHATHPTPLSRANRALSYAQKMLKEQAAAAA